MRSYRVDVAIIGAGTSGMTAYRAVKRTGKSVVLIESGPYGTTCARVGCMPSKLLIAAADAAHAARNAEPFGVHVDGVRIDGQAVMQRVRNERDRFVGFVLDDIAGFEDRDKIRGHARFLSDTELQVDDHTRVTATSIVLATGSSPRVHSEFKYLGDRLVVNDDVFNWQTLPQRVLVVGAGVIGLELGQALSRLGVRTTVINRSGRVGGLQDPVVRDSAIQAFSADLDLRLSSTLDTAHRVGDEVHIRLGTSGPSEMATSNGQQHSQHNPGHQGNELVVDYILMATGRKPNLGGLGLENTSVKLDDNGSPVFDAATLQLAPAPIFIAGDVTGTLPILHEAADEGRIAGLNAASYPDMLPGNRRAPIAIVFTDPQLAYVGQRYSQLEDQNIVTGEVAFSNQGRSRIILKNYGKLRVYCQAKTGLFLGAEMAGPAMEHIAHLLSWAVQQNLTVHDMLAMPFYHPVIEEGLRTALRDAAGQLEG